MSKLKPIHLLAGHGLRENLYSLIQTVFRENELSSPTVAYIGTASKDDETFFQRTANTLLEAGADKVNHVLIASEGSDIGKAKNLLNSADIIFISGGDVFKGIQTLKKKNMIGFLHELYVHSNPFFGLSAGSIMLAKNWVQWVNPEDDSTAKLFPCLDLAPIICDTHGEQDDWEELKTAINLSKDNQKGYGIVSGAAMKVYPNGSIEAFGGAINQFIRFEGKIVRLPDLLPIS